MNDDISAKLGDLLSDPERLKAVMSVVSSVMQTSSPQSDREENPPPQGEREESPPPREQQSAPAFIPSKKDDRAELLRALKPFLGETRRGKVDKIIKVMSVAELAGLFFKE